MTFLRNTESDEIQLSLDFARPRDRGGLPPTDGMIGQVVPC